MGKFKSKTGKSRVGTALSKIGGAVKKASQFGAQGGLVGKAVASAKGSYGSQAGSSVGFGSKPQTTQTKAVGVSYGPTPNTPEGPQRSSGGGSSISQGGGSSQIVSRERTQPVVPATIGEKPVVDIPTVPVDQTDYLSMIPQAPQTPLDQFQAQQKTDFETMMDKLVAPPSTESIYAQAQKESGILKKQEEVNRLSEQLNMIQSTAQANQLKTIGQGRGIPEAILGGQQAQIGREAAIAALPVSAQLQAAQGNLEMAEQNLNTLFSIRSADARAKYEYKNNLIKSVYDFASGQQKQKLDYAMKLEDRKYQEEQARIQFQNDLYRDGLKSGLTNMKQLKEISNNKNAQDATTAIQAKNLLDEYNTMVKSFGRSPSISQRKQANSFLVNVLAPKLSVALGQGGMTGDEAQAKIESLGLKGLWKREKITKNNIESTLMGMKSLANTSLQALDSAYPGASDTLDIFKNYKMGDLPKDQQIGLKKADAVKTFVSSGYDDGTILEYLKVQSPNNSNYIQSLYNEGYSLEEIAQYLN